MLHLLFKLRDWELEPVTLAITVGADSMVHEHDELPIVPPSGRYLNGLGLGQAQDAFL